MAGRGKEWKTGKITPRGRKEEEKRKHAGRSKEWKNRKITPRGREEEASR